MTKEIALQYPDEALPTTIIDHMTAVHQSSGLRPVVLIDPNEPKLTGLAAALQRRGIRTADQSGGGGGESFFTAPDVQPPFFPTAAAATPATARFSFTNTTGATQALALAVALSADLIVAQVTASLSDGTFQAFSGSSGGLLFSLSVPAQATVAFVVSFYPNGTYTGPDTATATITGTVDLEPITPLVLSVAASVGASVTIEADAPGQHPPNASFGPGEELVQNVEVTATEAGAGVRVVLDFNHLDPGIPPTITGDGALSRTPDMLVSQYLWTYTGPVTDNQVFAFQITSVVTSKVIPFVVATTVTPLSGVSAQDTHPFWQPVTLAEWTGDLADDAISGAVPQLSEGRIEFRIDGTYEILLNDVSLLSGTWLNYGNASDYQVKPEINLNNATGEVPTFDNDFPNDPVLLTEDRIFNFSTEATVAGTYTADRTLSVQLTTPDFGIFLSGSVDQAIDIDTTA